MPFTVALLTDTHVRAEPHDPQSGYDSDALQNDRLRRAVQLARGQADLAIHLGDLTHPLPGMSTHAPATALAHQILGELGCPLHVLPGNHDVGDKPHSGAAAPRASEEDHALFERTWGSPWKVVEHEGVRLVLLDSPILNSGSDLEARQQAWLETVLAEGGRTFLFLHDPPYILAPDEPPHYDNLAEPARTRLLELCQEHLVEAIFSGHVHHRFINRYGATALYCLPSTAFTRPEYSELFAVEPTDENGRNDSAKLGLSLLHVDEGGHRLEHVPLMLGRAPAGPCPVGVWLNGGWARSVDLPMGDLDPFTRKPARDDYPLLALLDLGIGLVRVPLGDLADPSTLARLVLLHERGVRVLAASPGAPSTADLALVERNAGLLEAWEIIGPPGNPAAALPDRSPVPLALSVIDPGTQREGGYFSHFPEQGFVPGDALPSPAGAHWLAFRATKPADVEAAVASAARVGARALVHAQLPRAGERIPHTDDEATARFVSEVVEAATAHPKAIVLFDTFADKDRGYWPRNGIIDRRGNLRLAGRVLRAR